MELTANVVNWFEIPAQDLDRAMKFYLDVFGYEMQKITFEGEEMAFFPWVDGQPNSSGSLVKHKDTYAPSDHAGVLIYFSSPTGDLSNELKKVDAAGGKIIQEKKEIGGGHGYFALFMDSEGNRLAMHSPQK
jgi:hypothetical protein